MAGTVRKQAAAPAAVAPQSNQRGVASSVVDIDLDPERATRQFPSQPPNGPFMLAYHPKKWCVRDGRVYPSLGRIPLIPGVEGAYRRPDGSVAWRDTVSRWQDRGWTPIKPDHGPGGQSYLRATEVAYGKHHHTMWEAMHAGTDRVTEGGSDYVDWLDSLFASGVLPTPELWPLEDLRDSIQTQRDALASKAQASPGLKPRVDALTANLDAINAKIGTLLADLPAAPSSTVTLDG